MAKAFGSGWAVLGGVVLLIGLASLLWRGPEPNHERVATPADSGTGAAPARERPPATELGERERSVAPPSLANRESERPTAEEPLEGLPERRDWIEERYQNAQARRAEIKDAATAEHRKLRPDELAQSWGIEFELVDEIGSSGYDRMLYDEGRANRTKVHWVGPGSNADLAGIERGDIPISFDGHPVFSPQFFRERKWEQNAGAVVPIEVLRNGEIVALLMTNDELIRSRSGVINGMTLLPFAEEP